MSESVFLGVERIKAEHSLVELEFLNSALHNLKFAVFVRAQSGQINRDALLLGKDTD